MPHQISDKKPHTIKKWLPAILAALALHFIIIFVFLNSQSAIQNSADDELMLNTDSLKTQSSIGNSNSIKVTTLSESTKTNVNQDVASNEAKVESLSSDISIDISRDSQDNNGQNRPLNHKDSNKEATKDLQQSVSTLKSEAQRQETPGNTSQQQPISQSSTLSTSASNSSDIHPSTSLSQRNTQANMIIKVRPKSDVGLLASDLPTSINTTPSNSLAEVTQEVEDINAKLSATIDTVKEQNKRQLEAMKTQEENAYLSDKKSEVTKQVTRQVANVGQQLGIDELAESEFSEIQAGDESEN